MGVDNGGFGDEQGTRGARTLSIILKGEVSMDVVLVRPTPRHRTENDAMFEVHTTNTDRLKEFRHYRHFDVDKCEVLGVGELRVFGGDFPTGFFSTSYL